MNYSPFRPAFALVSFIARQWLLLKHADAVLTHPLALWSRSSPHRGLCLTALAYSHRQITPKIRHPECTRLHALVHGLTVETTSSETLCVDQGVGEVEYHRGPTDSTDETLGLLKSDTTRCFESLQVISDNLNPSASETMNTQGRCPGSPPASHTNTYKI